MTTATQSAKTRPIYNSLISAGIRRAYEALDVVAPEFEDSVAELWILPEHLERYEEGFVPLATLYMYAGGEKEYVPFSLGLPRSAMVKAFRTALLNIAENLSDQDADQATAISISGGDLTSVMIRGELRPIAEVEAKRAELRSQGIPATFSYALEVLRLEDEDEDEDI